MSMLPALLTTLILCLTAGIHGVAQGPAAEQENGRSAQDTAKADQDQKLQKYIKQLAKAGPDAQRERSRAVAALLSLPAMDAHMALCRYLDAGKDPDGRQELILSRLVDALENPEHEVFAVPGNSVQRKSYIICLLRYTTPQALELSYLSKRKPKNEDEERVLRHFRLARRCLRALPLRDLEAGLRQLLAAAKDETQKAAVLRAAGETRHRGLAGLIAEYLDREDGLRMVAQSAIFHLIYDRPQSRAEYLEWEKNNRGLTYTDVVERAARSFEPRLQQQVAPLLAERQALGESLVEELARSSSRDKWGKLRSHVFGAVIEADPELFQACLKRLCKVLREPRLNGGEGPERLQLMGEVERRWKAAGRNEVKALLLEVASYLCKPTQGPDLEAYERQRARLLAALADKDPWQRTAALRGLQRFFSDEVLGRVVVALTQARSAGRVAEVESCLATLGSPDWRAPATDSKQVLAWVGALSNILKDQQTYQESLRREAVRVLVKEDAKGSHPAQVFDSLLQIVKLSPPIESNIRQQILLSLRDLQPKEEKAAEAFNQAYLDCMVALLKKGEDPSVRRAAADNLRVFDHPGKASAHKEGERLVGDLQALLPEEQDPDVFRVLVVRLEGIAAADPQLVEASIRTLHESLDKIGRPSPDKPGSTEMVAALVKGIEGMIITKAPGREGLPVAQWIPASQSLLAQGRRDSLRRILSKHLGTAALRNQVLGEQSKLPEPLRKRLWTIILQTANLRQPTEPWQASERADKEEADLVLAAVAALGLQLDLSAHKELDSEATRIHWLHSLYVTQAHERVSALAKAWLDAAALKNGAAAEARLLWGRSLLAQGKLGEAWRAPPLASVEGPRLKDRLSLGLAIGRAAMKQGDHKLAVEISTDLVSHEPKQGSAYWPRLRFHLEASHNHDTTQASALLETLNTWLQGNKLEPQDAAEAAKLRARLSGASPGK